MYDASTTLIRLSIVEQVRSFHRRRLQIPVKRDAIVLDVGSGDKPHWRADVLLERYIDSSHGGQRSGAASARVDRPTFEADAAAMPFADQVFDYVICSHVLEHVVRPDQVIAELVRVAKAGYIEVPEAASAKIVDFPSHLWWVTRDGDVLVFTAKSTPYFDADIDRYLDASGMRQAVADLLDQHLDHRVIELRWQGSVATRVVGSAAPELIAAAHDSDVQHRGGQAVAARVVTAVLTFGRRRHRGKIQLDSLLKPALRTGSHELLARRTYQYE